MPGIPLLAALLLLLHSLALAHPGHGTPLENLSADATQKKAIGAYFGATLFYDSFPETRRGEIILEVYTPDLISVPGAAISGFIFPSGDEASSTTLFFHQDRTTPQMHVVRPLIPGGIPHTMEVTINNFSKRETLRFTGIEAEKASAAAGEKSSATTPPPPAKHRLDPTQWIILAGAAFAGAAGTFLMFGKQKSKNTR